MSDSKLKMGNTVNRFLHMKIDREDELQQIVELAANICNVPIAMITFIDNQTQHIKFKFGIDHSEISSIACFSFIKSLNRIAPSPETPPSIGVCI